MTGPLTPPLDLITTAVLGLLRTGSRVVFDGAYSRVPELIATNPGYAADPAKPAYPYDILYALFGGDSNPMPDLDDDNRTVTVPFQVTSVSRYRNQAQAAARQARDLLVGKTRAEGLNTPWVFAHELPMPDGWRCIDRRPDPALPGVDRTGETPNAIFSSPARYLLTITPA